MKEAIPILRWQRTKCRAVEVEKPQKAEPVKEKGPITKMSYKDQREYDTIEMK